MKLILYKYNSIFYRGRSTFVGRFNRDFCPLLPLLFSITCLPALFFACTPVAPVPQQETVTTDIHISFNAGKSPSLSRDIGIDRIQVMVYNDDAFSNLDSRMFFTPGEEFDGKLCVSSGSGNKTFVVACNLHEDFPRWENLLSLNGLGKVRTKLEDESLATPVLTGYARAEAGKESRIEVKPLTARIRLNRICCDFRGTAYAFEQIHGLRVYLTNVNADSPLLPDGPGGKRFINNGALNPLDLAAFRDRSILCREAGIDVGMDMVETDIEFLCYSNPNTEEAFGCPLTRMVVEGSILGKTWYWPIDLCKMVDGGIKPGENYDISLTILRTGTEDPDLPVRLTEGEIKMEITQWNEKENYPVYFRN